MPVTTPLGLSPELLGVVMCVDRAHTNRSTPGLQSPEAECAYCHPEALPSHSSARCPRETLERLQDILQARTPAIKSSLGSLLSVFLGSLPYPHLLVLTYMQSLRPRLWLRAEPSTAAELVAGLPTLFSRLQVPCLDHERLCSMASLFISNPT